jgi:hypothetical protein
VEEKLRLPALIAFAHKPLPCRKKVCSVFQSHVLFIFSTSILISMFFLYSLIILFISGWLTKEGGSIFKNWKRRWSVLDPSAGTLTYYETQNTSQKPNGVVLLEGTTVARLAKKAKGKDNCFVITGPDRIFYAFADKKDEADSWVEALAKAFVVISVFSSQAHLFCFLHTLRIETYTKKFSDFHFLLIFITFIPLYQFVQLQEERTTVCPFFRRLPLIINISFFLVRLILLSDQKLLKQNPSAIQWPRSTPVGSRSRREAGRTGESASLSSAGRKWPTTKIVRFAS